MQISDLSALFLRRKTDATEKTSLGADKRPGRSFPLNSFYKTATAGRKKSIQILTGGAATVRKAALADVRKSR